MDNLEILVTADIDTNRSSANINAGLKNLSTKPVKVQVQADAQSLTALQKQINAATSSQSGSNMSAYYSRLEKQSAAFANQNKKMWSNVPVREYTDQIGKTNDGLKQMAAHYKIVEKAQVASLKAQAEAETISSKKDLYKNRMTTFFNENTKAAKKYSGEISNVSALFDKANDKGSMKTAINGWTNLESKIKAAGDTGRTSMGELMNNVQKFVSWFAIGGVVSSIAQGAQQMVQNVRDIDAALVDLRMATGDSYENTAKLIKSYNELGQTLGATTTEVSDAAGNWLRQGKTLEETNTLITDSMILSKVGNIESADATKYLTTAMKGYGVSAEDTLGIVDKLSAIDLVSATDAGGLAEGMSEVATNADLAGISMDKLLGYLAVVGETTGASMSSVGNSFSTMLSRMGNIKLSRLKDYETGEDLSNVETVLRGLGIELREDNETFRNFGEVLDDVGGKWGTYSDVNKRAIASAVAGKDHMEDFLVLMKNYGTALSYTETATGSSGSAMEKMGMYEESVEAKTKKLTASFEAFSSANISGGFLSGLMGAGSGILNFLTSITETLGTIPTMAIAATTALSLMGKNGGKQLICLFVRNCEVAQRCRL